MIKITNDFNICKYVYYSYILLKLSWKNDKWKEIIDSTIDKEDKSYQIILYTCSKKKYAIDFRFNTKVLFDEDFFKRLPDIRMLSYYNHPFLKNIVCPKFVLLKNLQYLNLSSIIYMFLLFI